MEVAPLAIRSVDVVSIPVNHRGDWLFVALTDEEGRVGYGEASHSGDDRAVAALLRGAVGERLRAERWTDPASAWLVLRHAPAETTARRVIATAASAVEQALWDLTARRRGLPLARLLGADDVAAIPLYANINRATRDRSPDGFAVNARAAVADGFRAVKLAPFDEVEPSASSAERRRAADAGLARVAAVRAAVGSEVRVLVDAHARFGVADAIDVARELLGSAVGWFEDPVPYEDGPDATVAVRRAAPLPIATGEKLIGAAQFEPFFDAEAADFYLPDVKHVGGLGQLLQLAEASRDRSVRITPHNPSGPISTLASASALAAVTHRGPLEFAWGEVPWRAGVLDPPERIVDGTLALPTDRPGLGAGLAAWVVAGERAPGA